VVPQPIVFRGRFPEDLKTHVHICDILRSHAFWGGVRVFVRGTIKSLN
jgi:hypothetical protein